MNKQGASSLIFLFAGIYGVVFSLQLPFGYLREPGPGMLPLFLSILLLLSGALGLIHSMSKGGKGIDWHGMVKKVITPLEIVGVTAGFILALESLGYLITSSLYTFLLFFWICRYRLVVSIGLSTSFGVGSWLFFDKLLSVPLPSGIVPL
ncbi:MAG: tripartite tricarboxylate transporter TctB family protein [Syntrophaceae bacterium]|nr:tripartite tricarboxylate transporter TctB family protein [Syntrophaceae bacterium]